MWFTHNRHHGNARARAYRFRNELGQEVLLVVLWDRSYYRRERRNSFESIFARDLSSERIEVNIFVFIGFVDLNECSCNVRAGLHKAFLFGGERARGFVL